MSLSFLRVLLAALCVLLALPFGRSVARRGRGQERQSRMLGWAVRTILTGAAVVWRGLDRISVAMLVFMVISFAAGLYLESRPKHEDNLEKVMFPRE